MLVLLVISGMISHSAINVFYTREAQVYQTHPQIVKMSSLRAAYEGYDATLFFQMTQDPTLF